MNAVTDAAPEISKTQADNNLFVTVPETTLNKSGIVVPSFLIGKFLCSVDPAGVAHISATDVPATEINFFDANKACDLGGVSLITNLQYLALAQDIVGVAANWKSGIIGEGDLHQGLHDYTVDEAQCNDFESDDANERRWFVLSNGDRIYDVAGHLYSWVRADIEGDAETGLVNAPFAEDSPSIITSPYPSMEKGVGWIPNAGSDWSGDALIRGGCWYSYGLAGAFCLDYVWPGNEYDVVGFRCTKSLG